MFTPIVFMQPILRQRFYKSSIHAVGPTGILGIRRKTSLFEPSLQILQGRRRNFDFKRFEFGGWHKGLPVNLHGVSIDERLERECGSFAALSKLPAASPESSKSEHRVLLWISYAKTLS